MLFVLRVRETEGAGLEDKCMIRFGIMGAGNIAHGFAGAVRRVEGAELAAVASKDIERAAGWARQENVPGYYGCYEDLLEDREIDAVYIATTGNYHFDNIKQCLEAGKHVICEKAMVPTVAQVEEVFSLAREKKLFVMEGMWSRFLPKTQKVREWVKSGVIGEIKQIQATIGFHPPRDMDGRLYNPALGGGVMYDLGVYFIDLIPYFVNQRIVDLQAWVQRAETGIDESVNLNLQLERCVANGQIAFGTIMPEDAYLYGERGYIRVPKLHWGRGAELFDEEQTLIERFEEPEPEGFVYEIEEAVRCIEQGRLESDIASWEMTLMNSRIYERVLGE